MVALVFAGCLAAGSRLAAQTPAGSPGAGQSKPAGDAQKPTAAPPQAAPQSAPQSGSNPFPEDTTSVPVIPAKITALPEGTNFGDNSSAAPLPGEDLDPVRSPDDPHPAAANVGDGSFSSSLTGLNTVLPGADDDSTDKRDKKGKLIKEPTHQEAASSDIDVGNYYVQTHNWKAALSRFQSAMVLDPANPDVFWGLAETERHLGDFADARTHYQKVIDYDPDSRHGKDARKALKDPEIANGKNAAPGPSTLELPK